MTVSRRYLPSTSLLLAFEVAARRLSFTRAAQELNLTQSAISRQISALEAQLGVRLFVRERQRVRLTQAGSRYAEEIRGALARITGASMMLEVNPHGGTLNLAVLPTLGSRWLAPRLAGFLDAHPGVTLNFSTRLRPFDFALEQFDAAIHFGQPNWPDTESRFLMNETMVPACSPGFLAQHGFSCPADLGEVQLIHVSSRPDAWARWFSCHGAETEAHSGMMFDQFATAAQAAKHGTGVALLPQFLIENELENGELVPALDLPMESEDAYYLAWPKEGASHPPLIAFRDWITRAARKQQT